MTLNRLWLAALILCVSAVIVLRGAQTAPPAVPAVALGISVNVRATLNPADGTYTLPVAPRAVMLYRNGQRLTPGVDYTRSTSVITPVGATWDEADIILVDCIL